MIRKILIANRGVSAARIIRTCRRLGISPVTVYSDDDVKSPHARTADEAVALGPSNGPQVYMDRSRLLDAARRTGADAVHPGSGFLAADAEFAAACESSGLTYIGPSADVLRTADGAGEAVRKLGIAIAPKGGAESTAGWRQIDIQVIGDKHGKVLALPERDVSIQKNGRKLLAECPATSLDKSTRTRLRDISVAVAREIGWHSAATVQFLVTPAGEVHWLGFEPFLSIEHTVTEAVTGLDLVELQLAIAESQRLPDKVSEAHGHAIAASLYADDASGSPSATRTAQVWNLPGEASGLRIDSGIAEGMSVLSFDPLLGQLICTSSERAAAIRNLSHALNALWIGGVQTDLEMLVSMLASQEYQSGQCTLGSLEQVPRDAEGDKARDHIHAAAWVMYYVGKRCAHRAILPEIAPGFRNNPYRDPSFALRVGATELTIRWRHLGDNRYVLHSGDTTLQADVLSLEPNRLIAVIDGIRREYRFREVAEEFYVHSTLGSQVIRPTSRIEGERGA